MALNLYRIMTNKVYGDRCGQGAFVLVIRGRVTYCAVCDNAVTSSLRYNQFYGRYGCHDISFETRSGADVSRRI
jgi:hypothetical protein